MPVHDLEGEDGELPLVPLQPPKLLDKGEVLSSSTDEKDIRRV